MWRGFGALKTWNNTDGSGPGPPLAAVLCQAVIRQRISKAMNSLFKANSKLGYPMLTAGNKSSLADTCNPLITGHWGQLAYSSLASGIMRSNFSIYGSDKTEGSQLSCMEADISVVSRERNH